MFKNEKVVYCIDANILIQAWQKYYSPEICPSYWEVLNDLGKKTRSVIVNLYIDCEKDYRKGVEEYNKIKENLQNKNGKKLEDQIGNTIEKEMTTI